MEAGLAVGDTIGGREPGESLDDALVREAFEEVGVRPTVFKQIASVPERRPEPYGRAVHHIYAVTGWAGGEPFNASDEHSELRWFSVREISLLQKIVDCDYARYAQLAVDERHGSL